MIKTKKIDGGTVTYNDDPKTRDAVFERLLAWFVQHQAFDGEQILQSDKSRIDVRGLLIDIADDIFEFDAEYDDG